MLLYQPRMPLCHPACLPSLVHQLLSELVQLPQRVTEAVLCVSDTLLRVSETLLRVSR